jgi:hypothetical protein
VTNVGCGVHVMGLNSVIGCLTSEGVVWVCVHPHFRTHSILLNRSRDQVDMVMAQR